MFAGSNVAITKLPTGGLNKNVGQTSKKITGARRGIGGR